MRSPVFTELAQVPVVVQYQLNEDGTWTAVIPVQGAHAGPCTAPTKGEAVGLAVEEAEKTARGDGRKAREGCTG